MTDAIMLCQIADLYVEIPGAGGMAPRLGNYVTKQNAIPDIVIGEQQYDAGRWPGLAPEHVPYMDSGWLFYQQLYRYGGMMLHASAVTLNGRAYLFSGPSGMGKSTHTRLWLQEFPAAQVFNDDKPVLRRMEDAWYAYGTPWCGKDGININMKVPLAGICFLRRGEENSIRRLSALEATAAVISQTNRRFATADGLNHLTVLVDRLVQDVPIWELRCLPEPQAAHLSYETMQGGKA